jgi:hypothetical protein
MERRRYGCIRPSLLFSSRISAFARELRHVDLLSNKQRGESRRLVAVKLTSNPSRRLYLLYRSRSYRHFCFFGLMKIVVRDRLALRNDGQKRIRSFQTDKNTRALLTNALELIETRWSISAAVVDIRWTLRGACGPISSVSHPHAG